MRRRGCDPDGLYWFDETVDRCFVLSESNSMAISYVSMDGLLIQL